LPLSISGNVSEITLEPNIELVAGVAVVWHDVMRRRAKQEFSP
jgi:hypothetical protein